MAQPPKTAPLRQQSSLDLVPAQPRVQPDLDALVEQTHHGSQQQQQQQQQLQQAQEGEEQQQHQHQQQQRQPQPHSRYSPPAQHLQHQTSQQGPESTQPPGALQTSDALPLPPGSDTHLADSKGGRSPGIGDEKASADGVLRADTSPNTHASVARPAEPAPAGYSIESDTQHNDGAPVPAFPDMSNTQPPPGPARQPVTYASPAAYPPAGMPPVSQYMYSVPSDPYRPNPTTLPSMRTLDHRQPQTQPQHGIPMGAHMAAPMTPAPAPPHMGYYGVHPHSHMYGLPDPNAMRFALAPGLVHDPRIALSGGRHKKEIKRRTKTGCLTCRKRRIKCDEAHPTCNNCKKSKRECLGYDPIFKQQQGPAAIQPAPSTQPPPPTAPVTTVPSSAPHPYHQTPSYPPPLPSNTAPDPAVSTAPPSIKPEPSYDYSTAIDPALQGADTTSTTTTRPPRYQPNNLSSAVGQAVGDPVHLRAKMKVDELVALGGMPHLSPSAPPAAEMFDEMTKLYHEVYVPGLVLFFETRWYDFAKHGAMGANSTTMLHNNPAIVSLFSSFIQSISRIKSTNPADMVDSDHLELAVVWALARLPLSVPLPQHQQYPGSIPAEDDPWEVRGRLQVFETLLAGETLASNPLTPPPAGNNVHPLRRNELEFWHQLSVYLLHDNASTSPAALATRERCLSVMRSLLDGRENRDVLYSIAVLREYTAHWDASQSEQNVPSHLEESDSRSKLAVATRFIRDESTSAGGTTNVVRRFADLAYRAFVRPGVNVNRSRGRV